jgi:hypothetical protein
VEISSGNYHIVAISNQQEIQETDTVAKSIAFFSDLLNGGALAFGNLYKWDPLPKPS